jgi:universal stress protein E
MHEVSSVKEARSAPIRRILVAIKDPRGRSSPAIERSAQLARALGARLKLFHARTEPFHRDMIDLDDRPTSELARRENEAWLSNLNSIGQRLRRQGIHVTTAVERDSHACEAILREAARFRADLIVAECHATRHRAPWLLRFTDWELLRASPVPVLLVKGRKLLRRPRILAALDPTHAFDKPARLDHDLVRDGAVLARALHGSLHAVHAFDPMPVEMTAAEPSTPEAVVQVEASLAARARAALRSTVRFAHIPLDRQHVVGRHAVDVIPDVAREIDAGVVVMGAVSRSALKRFFIGNTAEKLLDRLACDVLVVKLRMPPRSRNARKREAAP